jgi:hypothetical protein
MRSTNLRSIAKSEIKVLSGYDVASHPSIKHLREGYFCKLDVSVSGDAPKDFIAVYEYGDGRKVTMSAWPTYIAKVGHKYYPNESITEHLMTRIGQLLGMEMAESRLMWVRGQLRFLSRYFLRPDESLVHGAEIFAGHLADKAFVTQVELEKRERDIFTFQVIEEAVLSRFPDQADEIMQAFVRLLGFDTIVGNNDRHHFNWGVITQVTGKWKPRFSPIFDSARGLFWNDTEDRLAKQEHRLNEFLDRYVRESYPLIGWDGLEKPNHFAVVRKVVQDYSMYKPALHGLVQFDLPERVEKLLADEFKNLFSSRRQEFVVSCLKKRVELFADAVTR